jgi:hypothetical protein
LNFKQTPLKPVVTQQPITLDELKILLATAGAREKAIFMIMLQGGIDPLMGKPIQNGEAIFLTSQRSPL